MSIKVIPPEVIVTRQGAIRSMRDFVNLNIVDWSRYEIAWENPLDAMVSLSSWFVGKCYYSILQTNLCEYPEQDGFPAWNHSGPHADMGRAFWNHFRYRFCDQSVLQFSDSPDFYGVIIHDHEPRSVPFCGDIGTASPMALRESIQMLSKDSLWISVVNATTLVLIEPQCDLYERI